MRIAFLGTPEFALPSLEMLQKSGHTLAVFTQPDRPVGRHATLTPPPTKAYALAHGIPVYQFEKIRLPEGVAALRSFAPDLMVTAAFGQLLSAENLAVPKFGCINVHGSLLPKYRGAAPIQWAIINGETETGITTMMTDIGMDTGDILLADRLAIEPDETAGELFERMALLGAETLKRTIAALEAGTLVRTPQDEAQATKCPMLKKEHGKLDFSLSTAAVHNRVRGTKPWPGAYALLDGEPLKIHKTRQSDLTLGEESNGILKGNAKLGFFVRCADGWLEIVELQATGGRRLNAKDYLLGRSLEGKVLV
ncbi:MAG TPA: methionyl-tRNA formyltransferase [Clostridiales bacterium]|nr:methionyl-tRNA formyltransferase [Clostridiales bacterium]